MMMKKMHLVCFIFLSVMPIQFIYADTVDQEQLESKKTADQAALMLKKAQKLQEELNHLNLVINQLTNPTEAVQPSKVLLSPEEMQAASSSIFIPGGAPRPVVTPMTMPAKPQPSKPHKTSDNTDQKSNTSKDDSNLTDDSSNSANNNDNNYNQGGYPIPIPTSTQTVTLALNDYTSGTYNYNNSTSFISFDFENITLTLTFSGFSVYNLALCDSSYSNCQSVSASDTTNQYSLTGTQLNTLSSNLGASQITLSGGTYFIPTFYISYTTSSDSSTVLNGSFSFPSDSDYLSCSAISNIASCQLLQSASVSFNTSD